MVSSSFPEYDELRDLITRADATPWGKTCSELWAKAALLAEQSSDRKKAVQCYLNLVIAYTIGGEVTRCLAPFYWLVREYQTNPQAFSGGEEASGVPGQSAVEALGWDYKYAIHAAADLPNVSVAAIEQLFEQMRQLYVSQSDPLNSYYIRKYRFARMLGDTALEEEAYRNWRSLTERGPFADCEQCEPTYEVVYHIDRGEWKQALEKAKLAMSYEFACDSQPEELLTLMMLPYLYTGDEASAYAMHIRAYRRYQQHPRYLENLPAHLRYLAISGRAGYPGRSQRGLAILTRHLPWIYEAETPRTLYDMAVSSTLLLDTVLLTQPEQTEQIWPVTLAGDKLPWFKAPSLENPTFTQARDWFYQIASGLAAQYAAREGHPHPEIETQRLAAFLAPAPAPVYESDGSVPDVSGIIPQAPSSSAPATKNEPADGESKPADSSASSPAVNPQSQTETDPAVQSLPPIELTGPWQNMSLRELISTVANEKLSSNSTYCSQIVTLLSLDDALLEADVSSADTNSVSTLARAGLEHLTESEQEVFEFCRAYTRTLRFGETPPDSSFDADCLDPGLKLLCETETHLRNKDYMQAAICADKALYAQTVNPLGVRLTALSLLSWASLEAGYASEGIEYARQSVNLAAASGMWIEQACSTKLLCDCLKSARRWLELADVAQIGLDLLEAHRFTGLISKDLHLLLSHAHLKLEQVGPAAEHLERAIETFVVADTESIFGFRDAAKYYHKAHEYTASLRAINRAQTLAQELYTLEPSEDTWQLLTDTIIMHTDLIANQPGHVADSDFEIAEGLLSQLETLYFAPEHAPYRTASPQQLDVALSTQTAYVYLYCYRYALGVDMATSAMDKAFAAGLFKRYTEAGTYLFMTYIGTEQYALADEILTRMEEDLSVNTAGRAHLTKVKKLRRQLEERKDK